MGVRILVVDDEPDVEALFRQQFRREIRAGRFVLAFASSASDALLQIQLPHGADLILLFSDVNMPGMSGLQMLPIARAARPDVPVILITAYDDEETRRRALEVGAAGLLTKPVDFPVLLAEIDRQLQSHGGAP